jgi:hypothetical protein
MTKFDRLVCQCPISYHTVHFEDGRVMQVLDEGEELPSVMQMCCGRCERCGLPYHTEFATDEVF